jgi:hypothetical protein
VPDDLGVESISRETDASVSHEIGGCSASSQNRGANTKKRKIACSTAEISDQNELVLIEGRYAENRLAEAFRFAGYESVAFELEPVAAARYYESIVVIALGADELHWTTDDRSGDLDTELIFCFFS